MASSNAPSSALVFLSTTFLTYTIPTNLPALLTIYTAESSCRDRWLLRSEDSTNNVYSTYTSEGFWPVDKLYPECQPYASTGVFSPGVCPHEHTIGGAVEIQYGRSGSPGKLWQGYCCLSGMTYKNGFCTSTFSTPLEAVVPITTPIEGSHTFTPDLVYQYKTYSYSGDKYITETISSVTTLTDGGVAIADPIYVHWQAKDLSSFPPAYAASLAKQFSISFTPSPTASIASVSSVGAHNEPLAPSSSSSGLSTGAKAGIGVGAVVGAAAVVGVFFLLLSLARRRRNQEVTVDAGGNDLPEMIQAKRREGSDT